MIAIGQMPTISDLRSSGGHVENDTRSNFAAAVLFSRIGPGIHVTQCPTADPFFSAGLATADAAPMFFVPTQPLSDARRPNMRCVPRAACLRASPFNRPAASTVSPLGYLPAGSFFGAVAIVPVPSERFVPPLRLLTTD